MNDRPGVQTLRKQRRPNVANEKQADIQAVSKDCDADPSPTPAVRKTMTKDEHHLASLGYRQAFIRSLSIVETWAATFTTMNFVSSWHANPLRLRHAHRGPASCPWQLDHGRRPQLSRLSEHGRDSRQSADLWWYLLLELSPGWAQVRALFGMDDGLVELG